jgi:hypothetical protein
MDLRTFWKHKAETAPVARPPLPYLAELNEVMTNPAVRKGHTLRTMRKLGYTIRQTGFNAGWIAIPAKFGGQYTDEVRCVFGNLKKVGKPETLEELVWKEGERYVSSSSVYVHRRWEHRHEWGRLRTPGVCGIEVLGQRPNATGHTYSNECALTIKDLKQACKENGIKVGGMKKTEMLHALMKV